MAATVARELGLPQGGVLTGTDLARMDDDALLAALPGTSVFARVGPSDKSRIVTLQRHTGGGVAFLGDGVNDALALHAADVGISVNTATDVARDAADVILLEKDLGVLAGGVAEGRRIFANTMKYVLMGTSSNFGNMFSAAGASLFLPFLPMLPSQILLNNLLYDTGQLAIPTDEVDEEQLHRPSHWDIGFIRRFMLVFGPLSSLFDFATFGIMLRVFSAGPAEFRSGWFVESLATQTLVVLVIRTQRVPFFRSRPSVPLLGSVVGVVTVGAVLPFTPLAAPARVHPLPTGFFAALGGWWWPTSSSSSWASGSSTARSPTPCDRPRPAVRTSGMCAAVPAASAGPHMSRRRSGRRAGTGALMAADDRGRLQWSAHERSAAASRVTASSPHLPAAFRAFPRPAGIHRG